VKLLTPVYFAVGEAAYTRYVCETERPSRLRSIGILEQKNQMTQIKMDRQDTAVSFVTSCRQLSADFHLLMVHCVFTI